MIVARDGRRFCGFFPASPDLPVGPVELAFCTELYGHDSDHVCETAVVDQLLSEGYRYYTAEGDTP